MIDYIVNNIFYILPLLFVFLTIFLHRKRLIPHTSGEDSIGQLADLMIIITFIFTSMSVIHFVYSRLQEQNCKKGQVKQQWCVDYLEEKKKSETASK